MSLFPGDVSSYRKIPAAVGKCDFIPPLLVCLELGIPQSCSSLVCSKQGNLLTMMEQCSCAQEEQERCAQPGFGSKDPSGSLPWISPFQLN